MNKTWQIRRCVTALLFAGGAFLGTAIAAQTPAQSAIPTELEPINCWWETDRSSVIIGERFTLTLTCGTIETSAITVVPNTAELDPGAVQLTPFELVSGVRREDVLAPPYRYFQYDYTMRLIGAEFFGQDVNIPVMGVNYRIRSAADPSSEGRELPYVVPALPLRVASLVPRAARDIRDTPRLRLGDAEARRNRATTELVAGASLLGFMVILLGFAGVEVLKRGRGRAPALAFMVSPAAVLQRCMREAGRLSAEVEREGWTPERAGSALTVLRIGTALAMGQPVAQTLVERGVQAREGQIAVTKGLFRRKRVVVSAPSTSGTVDRFRTSGNAQVLGSGAGAALDDLRESLQVLSAARYGRNGQLDSSALDQALQNGRAALRRLRFQLLWPMRVAGRVTRSATMLRGQAWTR